MTSKHRAILGVLLLGGGLSAQAALEHATETTRPALKAPLESIPFQLGEWVGTKEEMAQDVLRETQADDYINRSYEHPGRPGQPMKLWINYSATGMNLRHSPEVCLPSGGWEIGRAHV